MKPEVLYLDNHLFVVNKAAGIPTQEDESGDMDLLNAAKAYLKAHFNKPGKVFLGLVHRLDRPVSGVIVFARTSKAASRLSDQFRRRSPEKRYLAIVEGLAAPKGRKEDYILKENRKVRIVDKDTPGAQKAVLSWRRIAREGRHSLLDISLETGRPHQIRVQLAGMLCPVCGDVKYGASRFEAGRIALHSYSMSIDHPTSGERMHFAARPPRWRNLFREDIDRHMRSLINARENKAKN